MKSKGFTVMEVVVALTLVIALSLLLLPTLRQMRASSDVTGCLNNLRQFGIAFQAYANDHNSLLPRTDIPAANGSFTQWPYLLDQYIGVNFEQAVKREAAYRATAFWCPAEKEFIHPTLGKVPYTYAMNRQLNERLNGAKAYIRRTEVRNPSRYVVMADGYFDRTIFTDLRSKMLSMTRMTRRHDGHPNFLYADGHVAPFTEEIYGVSDAEGRTNPLYQSLWNAHYTAP